MTSLETAYRVECIHEFHCSRDCVDVTRPEGDLSIFGSTHVHRCVLIPYTLCIENYPIIPIFVIKLLITYYLINYQRLSVIEEAVKLEENFKFGGN